MIFWCGCLAAMCQEPLPLLTPQQMPNPIRFLPPPPDTASAAFEYDKAQYRWGKEQRLDSVRLAIAVRDADWSIICICREFSEPFGMTISKEASPAIYQLLRTITAAHALMSIMASLPFTLGTRRSCDTMAHIPRGILLRAGAQPLC